MRLAIWLVVSMYAIPADAQTPLGRLDGRWEGQGTFQGGAVSGTMTWESVLSDRFTRLTLALKAGDRVVFEGQGFYSDQGAAGTWFDSQGSTLTISAAFAGDSLVSHWGPSPDRVMGRSVYRLSGEQMTVTDYLRQGERWSQFGRLTYRRVP